MLSVSRISKEFSDARRPIWGPPTIPFAIKDISFDVRQGQYFVLLGASGVGKSILLETIAGLIHPDSGQVFLDGKDITHEKIQNRRISLVFQNSALFPHMTVYDNIAYPLRAGMLKTQIQARVAQLAEDFAVTDLLSANPERLSGGESQRVSLARAIASEPKCLLLDEPISSLDVKTRSQMRALLRRINAQGQTIVHVTHDYTEAISLSTHIAVMEKGTVAQVGTVEEVFQQPRSEFVAGFVGVKNFFRGRLEDSDDGRVDTRRFRASGINLSVLTDISPGSGFVCIRSEDVTISNRTSPTSARNNFEGTVADIVPAVAGVEVIVDIGIATPIKIVALITGESVKLLQLHRGKRVWASFKASAVRYIEK